MAIIIPELTPISLPFEHDDTRGCVAEVTSFRVYEPAPLAKPVVALPERI